MIKVLVYETYSKLLKKQMYGGKDCTSELEHRKLYKVELPLKGIHGEKLMFICDPELQVEIEYLDSLYELLSPLKLYTDTIILDAYNSATIEGARTTIENVKASLKKGKEASASKDDKMVVNSVNGMNYALNHVIDSSFELKCLWDIVVDGVCENVSKQGDLYRSGMVYIGNETRTEHVPEVPEKIAGQMESLFEFMKEGEQEGDGGHGGHGGHKGLHALIKSFIVHFYYVYIHPMCDGNGRVSRILNNSYLYHNGYEKIMGLALSESINHDVGGYYRSIKESEEKVGEGEQSAGYLDITPFIVYMLGRLEDSLLSYNEKYDIKEGQLSGLELQVLEKMRKTGTGAELTVKKCAAIIKVSEEQAGKVLEDLSGKGYLQKLEGESIEIYRLKR